LKVLIAVDSSPSSERLLDEAVARPWPKETTFCVVNAVDIGRFAELPALIEDAKRQGEKLVKDSAARLAQAGHAAEFKVVWGHPRHQLPDYAADWGADFILVGSHGHGAIGRLLLGSVAQGLLRKAHCSVEIVRTHPGAQPPSSHPMKILLASDGSDYSLAAAKSVANRPWPEGSVLEVLSVEELVAVESPVSAASPAAIYPASLLEELVTEARNRASAAVNSAREILKQSKIDILQAVPIPIGDPRQIILDRAEAWPADLIVLGSHGRSGLDRILIGSVSETVAIHAHCSVEVIRVPVRNA
jgi:nucleotide-binding universal stress UspA family protein